MKPKNPDKLFPLFLTDKLEETKAYYLESLGFTPVHDMPSYLQLRYGEGDGAPELCFMKTDAHPDGIKRRAYPGEGVIVSVPTADADEAYRRMGAAGAKLESEPANMPWGWRSFFARDPNGVVLDFFHVYNENPQAS